MVVEATLLLLAFAKVQPAISTLVQLCFVFIIPFLFLLRGRGLLVQDYVFIYVLLAMLILGALLNQGNLLFTLKNGVYLLLLPLLRGALQYDWFKKRIFFLAQLAALVLLWHIIDPTSYITSEFSGAPRMVGFGVNPNVWGLTSLLLLASWRIWPMRSNAWQFFMVLVLFFSVILSGSSTALLCLPLCASMPSRLSWLYVTLLLGSICIFFWVINDDLIALIPSLFARFDLWAAAIYEIRPHTLVYGNGYDFFGAGISTVASEDIRIIDSFYISAFISGGIITFFLIVWYFMLSPLIWAVRYKNQTLLGIVLIFMIANATGNFLENGFPSNLIYWILVLSLQQKNEPQVRVN